MLNYGDRAVAELHTGRQKIFNSLVARHTIMSTYSGKLTFYTLTVHIERKPRTLVRGVQKFLQYSGTSWRKLME